MNDRLFDKIMFTERTIHNVRVRFVDILFIACIFVCSFLLRYKFFPVESPDYVGFQMLWMEQIAENGGFKSLGIEISNYTSPYMYLMCIVNALTDNTLYGLKYITILFDYVAALAIFKIVWINTESLKKSIFGMCLLLFSPAVVIDSAYWCQCDVIYSSLILYGIYYLFKDKSFWCFIFIGLAFSFKQQALFIIPFLIIMWLKKYNVYIRHVLLIPLVYVLMQLPACFFGRDLKSVLSIYADQAGMYPWGTLKYPNVYYLIDETMDHMYYTNEFTNAGIFLCIGALGILMYYIYTTKFKLTTEIILYTALFSVAIILYTLPHMHERYGFLLDLIAIIIAAIDPKKIHIFFMYSLISILCFMPFLLGYEIIGLKYVAIFNGALTVYVGKCLISLIQTAALTAEKKEA